MPSAAVRPVNALATIPLHLIDVHPGNPRARLEDIDELAASIRALGLLQPLVVERAGPDRFRLRMGHRRLAACRVAGVSEPLCMVTAPGRSRGRFLAEALVENGQRRDLNPMEIAGALRQLVESHGTSQEVAKLIGRSDFYVAMYLALLELPADRQQAVRTGFLSATAAYEEVKTGRTVARGRSVTGTMRGWHLSAAHPLAGAARARCDLPAGRLVGNVACGSCWEAAIREDAIGSIVLGDPPAAPALVSGFGR